MSRFCVYRYFDDSGALLYVGSTEDLSVRTGSHRRRSPWWDLAACMTIERFPSKDAMLAAERRAIADERPRFNVSYSDRSPAQPGRVLEPVLTDRRRWSPRMRRAMADGLRSRHPGAREVDIARTLGISVQRLRTIQRDTR